MSRYRGKKHRGQLNGEPLTYTSPQPAGGIQLETFVPWKLVKRNAKKQIITPLSAPQDFLEEAATQQSQGKAAQTSPLLRALGLAYYWQRLLEEGRFNSMTEIALAEGLDLGQASRMARLAQLAPDLVESIEQGRIHVGVSQLLRSKLPPVWLLQREVVSLKQR